jgi:hypothetical protein
MGPRVPRCVAGSEKTPVPGENRIPSPGSKSAALSSYCHEYAVSVIYKL